MAIALWVLRIVVAVAFLGAGFMKATQPLERLKKSMLWIEHTTPGIVRLIGIVEILGGLGLILPVATGILPWLTLAAAAGLVLTMLVAIVVHIRLKEPGTIAPAVLLVLSLLILLGHIIFVPLA
jgi:uncharacterized membrane protein YphA (DoxX/SURF4 family)